MKVSDPQGHQTPGKGPRFATISPTGKTPFVANELTDTVTAYGLREDGRLTEPKEIAATGSPVSIAFA
jgi:6-phosphogluconolactonase (cycloisomerase 2 family)